MLTETWKDIPNFGGSYQVSNMGRVRSVDRVVPYKDGRMRKFKGRVLKPGINNSGYEQLGLYNDTGRNDKTIHRLVLETFKPHVNMNDLEANHMDGNKLNNHLTNLEWVTRRDNVLHAYDVGLMDKKGERSTTAKLSSANVLEILQRLDTGEMQKDIALDFSVSKGCISNINIGATWREVREEYEQNKQTIPK